VGLAPLLGCRYSQEARILRSEYYPTAPMVKRFEDAARVRAALVPGLEQKPQLSFLIVINRLSRRICFLAK
jgi:hypothetical protein